MSCYSIAFLLAEWGLMDCLKKYFVVAFGLVLVLKTESVSQCEKWGGEFVVRKLFDEIPQ